MSSRSALGIFLLLAACSGCSDVKAPLAVPPAPITPVPNPGGGEIVRRDAVPAAVDQPAAPSDFKPPALLVGDPAPKFQVGHWLKGEPVEGLASDKTYVLECWATWCGPCIAAMPHVTELQEKYKDAITVIGVNIRERAQAKKGVSPEDAAEELEKKVVEFVEKKGDDMGYRVVRDDVSAHKEGEIELNWMRPAGQRGIPCTFVVHQGKIAWIGHPMELDPVLPQIVDGKWDFAKARTEHVAAMAREAKVEALQQKIAELVAAKDVAGVNKLLEEVAAMEPAAAKNLEVMRFMTLIEMDEADAAYALSDKLFEQYAQEPQALNAVAWKIVDQKGLAKRDFDLALKFAQKSNELTGGKNPAILDTLARVYFEKGEVDKAIETQKVAIEYAPNAASLKQSLRKYQAAKGE